jgi:hypothetical protein
MYRFVESKHRHPVQEHNADSSKVNDWCLFLTHLQDRPFLLCWEDSEIHQLQWTQNNCELQLRHWKRGREEQGGSKTAKSVWACRVQLKTFSPPLISTQSVAFSYTGFYTVFCEPNNYKTLAMQAHALTRSRHFYSLNVMISHPIVYKEGLGYLSVCAIASRSSSSPLPPLPLQCVFVTVIQARSYVASTVPMIWSLHSQRKWSFVVWHFAPQHWSLLVHDYLQHESVYWTRRTGHLMARSPDIKPSEFSMRHVKNCVF